MGSKAMSQAIRREPLDGDVEVDDPSIVAESKWRDYERLYMHVENERPFRYVIDTIVRNLRLLRHHGELARAVDAWHRRRKKVPAGR